MPSTLTYGEKKPAARREKKPTTCKPKCCPTCGGQECVERPRFFCGQLLNDEDLNAAQRYVIEKNRLHNRYLVGTGVVCGLAVRCDPCEGSVIVEPGYAIDCCGNDIVLCDAEGFDVAGYIKTCLGREAPDCEDKIRPRPSTCDERPKEYCLMVSYSEEPSRPVTALARDGECSPRRCEPSRTRETFRFDLVEKPGPDKQSPPDLWKKLRDCVTPAAGRLDEFRAEHDALGGQGQNPQSAYAARLDLFCRMRDYVLGLYENGPDIRCTLAEEISLVEKGFPQPPLVGVSGQPYGNVPPTAPPAGSPPAGPPPTQSSDGSDQIRAMEALLGQYIVDCFCDALLVPCAPCCEPEGVLLACLTVQNGRVVSICNTARRQVITGPAMRYWLGPLFNNLHRVLERLCCELEQGRRWRQFPLGAQRFMKTFGVALSRGKAAVSVATSFVSSHFLRFFDPDVQYGADLHGLTVREARESLRRANVTVANEIPVSGGQEAQTFHNLKSVADVLQAGSSVDILKDAHGRVAGIRVRKETGQ